MSGSADNDVEALCRARVGSSLRGKWVLDDLLGVGGMGAVYAGTHRNGSRVAVKMLHPHLASDPDSTRRFLREGYVANKVPGAVRVIDDDVTDEGAPFLVMELLEGQGLHDAMAAREEGAFAPAEVLDIARQVLEVLANAHEAGVVHRDLKPENLFIDKTGAVRILDFGIARLRELSGNTNQTKAGTLMGTPSFMPPEQALGYWDQIDGRTDLWAVGAVMFTLSTGVLVHHAKKPCRTPNEELLAAMSRAAPPIREIAPRVPAPVAKIIDRALAFEMADRFADARAMLAEVDVARELLRAEGPDAWAAGGTLASQQVPAPPSAPKPTPVRVVSAKSADDDLTRRLASGPTAAPVSSGARTVPREKKSKGFIWGIIGGAVVAGVAIVTVWNGGGEDEPARSEPPASGAPSVDPSTPERASKTAGEPDVEPVAPSPGVSASPALSATVASAPSSSAAPLIAPAAGANGPPPAAGTKPPPPAASSSATSPWSKWE